MKLMSWGAASAAGLGLGLMTAWAQEAATNAPAPVAATQAVAEATAPVPAAEGWTGFVRVLRDSRGDLQGVRLVAGDRLLAVELNDKAREMAKTSRTQKLSVSGSLEERDGRSWLVVTDFKNAVESAPVPPPAPVAAPPAGTQAVAAVSAPADTNAPPVPAATNAPAAP